MLRKIFLSLVFILLIAPAASAQESSSASVQRAATAFAQRVIEFIDAHQPDPLIKTDAILLVRRYPNITLKIGGMYCRLRGQGYGDRDINQIAARAFAEADLSESPSEETVQATATVIEGSFATARDFCPK